MNNPSHQPTQTTSVPESYDGYSKYGVLESAHYEQQRDSEVVWCLENSFIKKYFSLQTAARVLDAPVGTGRFLSYYPMEAHIIGLDISEHMLKQALKKVAALNRERVELTQGDIFNLIYGDKFFDTVICWRLLHLLPEANLVPLMTELKRVCSGRIIVQTYLQGPRLKRLLSRIARGVGRALRVIDAVRPTERITTYIHSRPQIERAFAEAGLDVQESTRLGYYFGHEVHVYVLEQQNRAV
ncbi:class I SAM-dependent methyltransferase [Methylococcus sp. EFPC2]|uniref:class I SAM-dependent methyltransferase n=1 Tax=Methylococcus sp. EFPC2 TaxID=2812648 RepID=UPI00196837D2|nr:class I SAM-dependent methyltransferase [Methylococcus sp. EFPC2]QSA96834.1 class I SAM-dependent methyltransferase [Methylococcus sp. EFPC2]